MAAAAGLTAGHVQAHSRDWALNAWVRLVLVLAAAALTAAAQNDAWAAPLVLVSLVPLFIAIADSGFGAVWLRLGVFYSLLFLLSLSWITLAGPGTHWLLPAAIAYSWIFFAVLAAAVRLVGGTAGLFALAPAWVAMEMLSRLALFRINWIVLGQPLADLPLLAQAAAIGGPETSSLVVLLVNAGLACLILRRGEKQLAGAAIAAVTLAAALLFGGLNLAIEPDTGPVLSTGLVQPMNSQRAAWTAESRGPILRKMGELIDRAAGKEPDLIVLPEWAVVGSLRHDAGLAEFATSSVRRARTPLLLGAGDFEAGRFYNAATLITTDGRVFTYRKRRLIPFVEYAPRGLPFEPPVWVRFSPGENAGVFPLAPGIGLGVMICLEDTLPDAARDYANGGATVLAALVNTADFAGTPEALQHLRRARLTAIAVGLPMLRAANSGISCTIDSRGRVPDTIEPGRPEAKVVSLPLDGRATPYRWWGDAGVLAFMAAMMLAIRYAALRMRLSAAARSAPRPARTG